MLREEPLFRSWHLKDLQCNSEQECRVTVVVERSIQGRFVGWPVSENWCLEEGDWRVQVRNGVEERRKLWKRTTLIEPIPGVLEVVPSLLKLHFLSKTRTASILIRNGLSEEVEVAEVDYDRERLELLSNSPSIPQQATARVAFRYTGDEIIKNLTGEVRLTLKYAGQEQVLTIPVIYNYISPAARGLFGLTQAGIERLRRGDRLIPQITLSSKPNTPKH